MYRISFLCATDKFNIIGNYELFYNERNEYFVSSIHNLTPHSRNPYRIIFAYYLYTQVFIINLYFVNITLSVKNNLDDTSSFSVNLNVNLSLCRNRANLNGWTNRN